MDRSLSDMVVVPFVANVSLVTPDTEPGILGTAELEYSEAPPGV